MNNTIGQIKAISDNSDCTSRRVEPVDLVGQSRRGSEVLEISIERVGKIDVSITRIDRHIIERVELAAEVVVDKHYGA